MQQSRLAGQTLHSRLPGRLAAVGTRGTAAAGGRQGGGSCCGGSAGGGTGAARPPVTVGTPPELTSPGLGSLAAPPHPQLLQALGSLAEPGGHEAHQLLLHCAAAQRPPLRGAGHLMAHWLALPAPAAAAAAAAAPQPGCQGLQSRAASSFGVQRLHHAGREGAWCQCRPH
eukprot:524972-Pelagomonas_calceolata.AAC.3